MIETMVDYEPIVEILIDIFGEYKFHNEYSGQIAFSCPVCSYEIKGLDHLDGKGNLEINYKLGVYKCWSCAETHDTHGVLHYLIRKYGNRKQLKKFELLVPDERGEIEKKAYKKVKLPSEFISFKTASAGIKLTPYYKQALNYLKERNVTDEMIEKFSIGFCYEGKYANRIVIPSYDAEGELNYFVARSYETRPYRKYDNPEAEKQTIIFNEHLIDWSKCVYITEGIFDSMFLPNSIPMLGKSISDTLFNKLYENASEIVIVLDGDAIASAHKLFYKLNGGKLFNKVWIIELPIEYDVADLKGNLINFKKKQLK
jgi:DNA primase